MFLVTERDRALSAASDSGDQETIRGICRLVSLKVQTGKLQPRHTRGPKMSPPRSCFPSVGTTLPPDVSLGGRRGPGGWQADGIQGVRVWKGRCTSSEGPRRTPLWTEGQKWSGGPAEHEVCPGGCRHEGEGSSAPPELEAEGGTETAPPGTSVKEGSEDAGHPPRNGTRTPRGPVHPGRCCPEGRKAAASLRAPGVMPGQHSLCPGTVLGAHGGPEARSALSWG